jgi:hypothetical protein
MTAKVLWDVVRHAAAEGASPGWPRTICDARGPGCVTSPAANWTRSSSSSVQVSIQTTERYLGCKQKLRHAVNDRLGIEPNAA